MSRASRKIVVVGVGGVGKSACTIQFVAHHFIDEYDPTIEDTYRAVREVDGEHAVLDILDTAGEEEFSSMRAQYLRGGEGFILMYAVTASSSLEEMQRYARDILSTRPEESLNRIPIVVAGNKADLEEQREVEYERGKCYADEIGAAFFETSAKTRQNIEEEFHEIVRRIRYHQRYFVEHEKEAARRKGAFVWYALKFSALPVEVVKRIAEEVDWISGVPRDWKPAPHKRRRKCSVQ